MSGPAGGNAGTSEPAGSSASRNLLRTVLSLIAIACFLGLTAYLFSRMNLRAFFGIWRQVSWAALLFALAIYFSLNFFRSLRFKVVTGSSLSLGLLFPVTLYYNFLAQTLPFRTGELSYVVILRRHRPGVTAEGAGALVGSKLFELLMVMLGGCIGVISLAGRLQGRTWILAGLLLAGLLACVLAISNSGVVVRMLSRCFHWLGETSPLRGWPLVVTFAERLDHMGGHLQDLRRPRRLMATLACSFCTYGLSVAFSMWLLTCTGIAQAGLPLLAVISLVMAAGFLPLSIAGLGVVEGSWAFGLSVLLGIGRGEAIAAGFFIHGCQLMAACISGMAGYIWQKHLTK